MKPKIAVVGRGNVGGAIGRGLERAGYQNIQLGYMLKMGTEIGFKLIH